jgi:hypothetical protein
MQVLCNPLDYQLGAQDQSLLLRQVCSILNLEPTMLILGRAFMEPDYLNVDASVNFTSLPDCFSTDNMGTGGKMINATSSNSQGFVRDLLQCYKESLYKVQDRPAYIGRCGNSQPRVRCVLRSGIYWQLANKRSMGYN